MLNQYINEFKMIKVSYAMAGTDPSSELTSFFNKVYDCIEDKNNRKQLVAAVEDHLGATFMFFEMFLRKIGGDLPITLTYYFATLTTSDESLTAKERNMGNFYRAAILVKAANQLNHTMTMISNMGHDLRIYQGHLDYTNFTDITILYDVYKAWDADPENRYLQFLKSQVPSIETKHSYITKQYIETEGKLAHDAILKVLSMRCF